MEHTTRITRHPWQPAAAARRSTRVPRPATRAAARPRQRAGRLPGARLTGLGCGVLASAVMIATAWLCEPIGGAPTLYGVVFVLTAGAAGLWVRPADLVCAPVAAPLAFVAGLVATRSPLEAVTELALRAPWLFGGTMLAVGLVLARRALHLLRDVLARRRRRARRRAAGG